jgi:hypothetical protein
MITVKLMGGMGNQMWQFGFGLAQSRRLGVKLQLDTSQLGGKRPFSLLQWSLAACTLTNHQVPTVLEQGMGYNQTLVDNIRDGDVLQGYWQNEKYILPVEDELRQIFTPFRQRATPIFLFNSVAVHVRRGDYLNEPQKSYHGVLGLDYYHRAINALYKQVQHHLNFFVFTDDEKWVRSHLVGDNITVVKSGLEADDIHLMSLCKHAIIANSSFSWWGAWLGDKQGDHIVIAPEKWFDEAPEDYSGIIPTRWRKL